MTLSLTAHPGNTRIKRIKRSVSSWKQIMNKRKSQKLRNINDQQMKEQRENNRT